jgi:ribosomal protein S18 acetylase RimI-like enzyme
MLKYITGKETLYLRSTALRNNVPEQECIFETDHMGFHLGAFVEDQLVSVATFFPNDYSDLGPGGYQLRGMATATAFSRRGHGASLIVFALGELKGMGVNYLWCNARKNAADFYKKLNFEIISLEFEVPGIGPHYKMSIQIQ